MKLLNFLAVKLAILLTLGILLGYTLHIKPTLALILSVACVAVLAAVYVTSSRKSILFGVVAALATLSAGILSYAMAPEINLEGHYQKGKLSGEQLWHLKIRKTEKHTQFYKVYTASVLSLDDNPVQGSIQIRIKRSDSILLSIDDEVLIWGQASEITRTLNPYQWDYAQYLHNRNIHHLIRTSNEYVYPLNSSRRTIRGLASELRNTLLNKLENTGIAQRELGIVKAILLGDRADVSEETFNSFRKAGAIHLLAISGLHIGILLLLLRFMFNPLTRFTGGKHLALILSVAILWGYALLAGFSPSVIRAVAMFSFLAYSLFLNRITHGYNTLSLSLLFLLLVVDPLLLFEVGFQMSYAAVAAILWIYPVLTNLWHPRFKLVKRIWQLAAVSLAAQLGVLPISLFYFHQFPGLFLLSSLVVVPFLGLILGTGFIVCFLALLDWLPKLLIEFYGGVIFCLNEFINWVSEMDSFHMDKLPFGLVELLLTYLLIFFLIRTIQKPNAKSLRLSLVFILAIQFCGVWHFWDTRDTNRIIIGHQYGDPLLIQQQGELLSIFSSGGTAHPSLIRNYQLGARTRQLQELPLISSYSINGESLVRMDSSLILLSNKEMDYLWLTHSPKINLDRYLATYSPQYIIADGSSLPYLVNRWQESARLRNIPFHYTGRDGAFEFKR